MRDFPLLAKHCTKTGHRLFKGLAGLRKDMLAVSEEFYPLGAAGWAKSVESLADRSYHDDDHRILTSVPIMTARKASAGMLQNLTSKGQPWFYLSVPKTLKSGLSRDQKLALEKVTEGSRYLMARSNTYSAIYRLFKHYLVYGFGCMLVSAAEESTGNVIEAYTLRPGTFALGIGRNGRVNSVVRKFAWSPMEILEEFGVRNTPKWIRDAAKEGSELRVTVWNLIEPNHTGPLAEFDPVAKACDLAPGCVYRSVFWVEGGSRDPSEDGRSGILAVEGFDINPVIAPRLNCELGDTYGRGLGLDGLDLARGLQSFRFDILKGSGDMVQPALLASADLKDEGLRLGRGEVNYIRFGEQRQNLVTPVLSNPPNLQSTRECETVARQELETMFYIDAFTTMDLFRDSMGKVTATQINYAKAEGMQKLGAMVSNCEVEFLNVLVNTIWRWAVKSRVTPIDDKTAETIAEMEREVAPEYVSNIHQARRLSEMNGIQAWVQNVIGTKEAKAGDPVVDPADIMDADEINRRVGEILGVPTECIADDKTIAAKRDARVRQAEAAATTDMVEKGAGAVNKLGNTPGVEKLLPPLARSATGLA